MEEDKILRDNKIPGCDELTKPEEIKALSKYLRKIKDVQSEHTTLQKDNLEVPGRTTGRIPKISELPNTVETIDGRTKKVDLSKQRVNIPNQREENLKLSNYKKNLKDCLFSYFCSPVPERGLYQYPYHCEKPGKGLT